MFEVDNFTPRVFEIDQFLENSFELPFTKGFGEG